MICVTKSRCDVLQQIDHINPWKNYNYDIIVRKVRYKCIWIYPCCKYIELHQNQGKQSKQSELSAIVSLYNNCIISVTDHSRRKTSRPCHLVHSILFHNFFIPIVTIILAGLLCEVKISCWLNFVITTRKKIEIIEVCDNWWIYAHIGTISAIRKIKKCKKWRSFFKPLFSTK